MWKRIALLAALSPMLLRAAPAEELWLSSKDAKLAAVLRLPETPGPHPAAVLVHGSGRVTAQNMINWPGSRLLGMGIAVLAYDKRGVGRSTGTYSGIGPGNSVAMFDLLAADALAAVDLLKSRAGIDPRRIGLVGVSQAGWIAPLAASRTKDVSFLVIVSGPAVSVGEEIAYSDLAGEDPGSVQGLSDDEIARRLKASKVPRGFDPVPVLAGLAVPSLWILGEQDRSIPLARTIENLERLKRTGHRPITTHVVPGVNHGLRNPATGQQPDVWQPIRDWLIERRVIRR